jgi:hypothetical protein
MLRVEIRNKAFVVWLDEKYHAESVIGLPVTLQI